MIPCVYQFELEGTSTPLFAVGRGNNSRVQRQNATDKVWKDLDKKKNKSQGIKTVTKLGKVIV